MTRLIAAMRTDVIVQVRNNLYTIGIVAAILGGLFLSIVANSADLPAAIPITMLFVVGGSTLLYVAGMILFEKDEGTLHAVIVSPLTVPEYLGSKIVTLTTLATFESVILIAVTLFAVGRTEDLQSFNPVLLALGVIAIGVMYTLIGIGLIVRYKQITDFLVPVLFIALILQLPFLYFLDLVPNPLFLLIPTSAPTLLMQSAWVTLAAWEWVYALGYTAITLIALTIWAHRAFHTHIVMKVG